MSFFNFEDISFFRLPLKKRDYLGEGHYEVFFERPFSFLSGQVCAIHTGSWQQARLYSLANSSQSSFISFIYNEVPEGKLTPVLTRCQLGEYFYISPPFGNFILPSQSSLWIATGTGIAPFLSAVRSDCFDLSNMVLLQGARKRELFLFQSIFEESLKKKNYIRCCSQHNNEKNREFWAGRLTHFLKKKGIFWDLSRSIYLCGSSQMVVEVREILIDRGIPMDNIFSEVYF